MSFEIDSRRNASASGVLVALAISSCLNLSACSSYSGSADEGEVDQGSEALSSSSITDGGDHAS
jgi:hypothetical protein